MLALRLEVGGTAAHGATPWLGDNAVLNAIEVFRSIESLPFARQSSELFDRPSINLGGSGGRRSEQGARPMRDRRRYPLPARPGSRRAYRGGPGDARGQRRRRFCSARRRRSTASSPFVGRCARRPRPTPRRTNDERRARRRLRRRQLPAGRGAGGRVRPGRRRPSRPAEWVSISSLEGYRQALESFLRALPERLR